MKIETDRVPKELCESDSEQKNVEVEKACAPEDSSLQAAEIQVVTQNKTEKKDAYQKRKENMSVNKLNAIKERKNANSKQKHPNEDDFDDSTEERFYNQSSDSDSDSSDDFFIGKVKRKKRVAAVTDISSAKEKDRLEEKKILKKEKNTALEKAQDFVMEKGKPHAKGSKLESMFCDSLSTPNQKYENRRR